MNEDIKQVIAKGEKNIELAQQCVIQATQLQSEIEEIISTAGNRKPSYIFLIKK